MKALTKLKRLVEEDQSGLKETRDNLQLETETEKPTNEWNGESYEQ